MRGRIRSIKPEVHLDEELWDLEQATGAPVFRLFTGLWNYADREGLFQWKPRRLQAVILPWWSGDFEGAMNALVRAGFLVRYDVDGRTYGKVRTFKDHQVINQREAASDIPQPPATETHVHARADTPPVTEDAVTRAVHAHGEGKGREGKGAGREGSAYAGERAHEEPKVQTALEVARLALPDNWTLPSPALAPPQRPQGATQDGWTSQRQHNAFVAAYERSQATSPAMFGKAVATFHREVVRTAELQHRDPAELFREKLAEWLERGLNDAERRAPYACFQTAWGQLTSQGTSRGENEPAGPKELRKRAEAAARDGDHSLVAKLIGRAKELEAAEEQRSRRGR